MTHSKRPPSVPPKADIKRGQPGLPDSAGGDILPFPDFLQLRPSNLPPDVSEPPSVATGLDGGTDFPGVSELSDKVFVALTELAHHFEDTAAAEESLLIRLLARDVFDVQERIRWMQDQGSDKT